MEICLVALPSLGHTLSIVAKALLWVGLAVAVFVGVALVVLDKRVSIQNALMIAMMLSCKTRITGALFSVTRRSRSDVRQSVSHGQIETLLM